MLERFSTQLVAKCCAAAFVLVVTVVAFVVLRSGAEANTLIGAAPDGLGLAADASSDSDYREQVSGVGEHVVLPEESADEQGEDELPSSGDDVTHSPGDDHGALATDEADDSRADVITEAPDETPTFVQAAIDILWPEDGSHHDNDKIVFEGEASPGSKVFAGPYEADVDDQGHWRIQLILSPGANRATIRAEDPGGNVAEDTVTAWFDPPGPDHKTEPEHKTEPDHKAEEEAPAIAFTAHQQYGSCGEEIPYDVFYGTAPAHSVVEISSDYGGAIIEVGKEGHWEKKVYFENAPRGQAFIVTVAGVGGSKTFEFIALETEKNPEETDDPGAK